MKFAQNWIVYLSIFGASLSSAQNPITEDSSIAPVLGTEFQQSTSGVEEVQVVPPTESATTKTTPAAPEDSSTEGGSAPEAAPLAAPMQGRSLLKTAATKNYSKALYFDQLDNGVILPPLEFEYSLAKQDGKELVVGDVSLSEKNFFFALAPLVKGHSQLSKVVSAEEGNKIALMISWPEKLLSEGILEMVSTKGEVLWKHSFTQKDREDWKKTLAGWRKALLSQGVNAKQVARSGIFGSQLGLLDIESKKAPFRGQKAAFRFCLTQSDGRNSTTLCSKVYGTKSTGQKVVMGKLTMPLKTPRTLVNGKVTTLERVLPVSFEQPTSFYAELAGGETYEFMTLPNKLQLMDISDMKNSKLLKIVGSETRPTSASVPLNPQKESSLTKMLGFESTIGDDRKLWMAAIKKEMPVLYLPGVVGGVFKQRFELSEIPRMQSRVYLHKDTPKGTYIDGVKLYGRKQPQAVVSSKQNIAVENATDPALFVWNFRATERGKINRAYLDVNFKDKNFRSYYEMYKGFPRELSGRFTGVASGSEFLMLSEFAYNQWFEDLFGWDDYWMSRQRWGISGKFFNSINQLKVDTAGRTVPLSVLTLDAKYRMTPGLWGRDESVGAILSYQSVTFDKVQAPMLGVGAFWARSMPRVFDEVFNLLPFMRYSKWVDVEFLYYFSSLDSKVRLNAPMSLNFHGKVLWTDTIFGEAGFGLKRYSFSDTTLNQKAELNTFYGTVGIGLNF